MMPVLHADDDTIVPKHGPEVGAEMLKIESAKLYSDFNSCKFSKNADDLREVELEL